MRGEVGRAHEGERGRGEESLDGDVFKIVYSQAEGHMTLDVFK